MERVGKYAIRNARGQLAPGAVYIKEIIRIGTLPVTVQKQP
jgi:hypothetical protein